MLFIHGMACDHSDWREQLPHFSRSHRVVAIDMRGHGRTSNPGGEMHVEEIADDIAWVCRELGLEKPVVVGHSFGGLVSLAFGARYPDLPHALVLLDTSFDQPPELRTWLGDYLDSLTPETFREQVTRNTEARVHDPGDDPAVREHNVRMLLDFGLERFVATGRAILEYGDARERAQAITAPTLWVSTPRPFSDPAVVRQARPDWHFGRTVGAGHWHQVLVPNQVNAMIDDFLAQIGRGFPAAAPSDY